MNEIEEIKIENLIYEVRGRQVMLDCDVANLYGYETRELMKSLKGIWKDSLVIFVFN